MGLFSSIGKFISGGGGSLLGSVLDFGGGILSNSAASNSANKQMAFQQQMSNTSYQRAVEDMRLAGLNPALAYSQGGASTPSGSAYTPQNPAKGIASSLGVSSQIENTQANTALQRQQVQKAAAETAATKVDVASKVARLAKTQQDSRIDTSKFGRGIQWIQKGLSPLTDLLHGANSAKSLIRDDPYRSPYQ